MVKYLERDLVRDLVRRLEKQTTINYKHKISFDYQLNKQKVFDQIAVAQFGQTPSAYLADNQRIFYVYSLLSSASPSASPSLSPSLSPSISPSISPSPSE